VKPLRFASVENLGPIFYSVKSFWELDMQAFVLKNVGRQVERMLGVEFRRAVGCGRYRRVAGRKGQRNGYYRRGLLTLYGWLENIRVPRLRHGGWESEIFKRYRRRPQALDRLILEGFLLGHSTRKTVRFCQRVLGASISCQTISNIVKSLQAEVERFHKRHLADDYQVVYLDGLWVKIAGPVKTKKVLLVAYGMTASGQKQLVDFILASSESEACWWGFLADLKDRGLRCQPTQAIVHDGCPGLIKALAALYPRIKNQWCVFHKLANLRANLIDQRHRSQIAKDAASIYRAATEKELRDRLAFFKAKWSFQEPKAVHSFIRNLDRTLTYREYLEPLKTLIKTNNPLERYLEELQRRIKPFRKFANASSADRICYGIIAYVLDKPWLTNPQNLVNFTQST
jgi:putative transposase